MAEQSDAAKRAAARKAKILARGNTGLQKLAQTARGEEAETLYGETPSRTSSPAQHTTQPTSTTTSTQPQSKPSWAPSEPTQPKQRSQQPSVQDLSEEQRQMQDQINQMFGSFGQSPGGQGMFGPGAGGPGEMPDFQKMMAQMMGLDPSSPGQNLLGDVDSPAGLGGNSPFGGQMPDLSSLGGLGGLGGMPGMQGMGMGGKRSKVDKYWGIVHFISIFLFATFTIAWWEPRLFASKSGILSSVFPPGNVFQRGLAQRWAGLNGGLGSFRVIKDEVLSGVSIVPLFWAFTTLQLILQTTRFFILKSPPPPHSLLANFLPLIPPAIARPLVTASRYITLLTQTYKDGALLIFFIGIVVSLSPYFSSSILA